jgi:preprotein translocase subunit YajC
MNLVLGTVLLAVEAPSPGAGLQLLPMVLIFAIFYFLLIRPQQKRQKEHESKVAAIEKDDRVMTAGGLWGTVSGIADDELTVDVATVKGERVRVKVGRNKVEIVQKKSEKTDKGGAS